MPSPTNRIKSIGIMILFAFSIPPEIPYAMITAVTSIATTCHTLFPNAAAVPPNKPSIAATSCPKWKRPPESAKNVYLKIHPTTTLYPIANARDPITGITPITSPIRLFPVRISVHLPNALIGPLFAARPSAISSITPVEAIKITNRTYGSRNVIPPHSETIYGNLQIFPIPTADPMQASTNPVRLLKPSLCFPIHL